MGTLVAAVLAGLLAIGTVVGVIAAVNDKAPDRLAPSSSAPVYGNP